MLNLVPPPPDLASVEGAHLFVMPLPLMRCKQWRYCGRRAMVA
jgi:hypothetical protein